MDRVRRNEVSVRVHLGDEQSYLFDAHYDTIHTFRWLGHSILKMVDGELGFIQIHTSAEYGDALAENVGCEVFERETIGAREYESYIQYIESTMGDNWLED